ncbi:MAG: hypothetical protein JO038_03045 [Alphaproteobacteria bacterium]|nr:hypothetical protein [Alphaproteobacteria bacterium]
MIVGRLIGCLIFLAGLAVLVRDVLVWLDTGRWVPLELGQWWYDIDNASLNLTRAAIERYLFAALWDPVCTSILSCWAFAALVVIGGGLYWLCRERVRRRFA